MFSLVTRYPHSALTIAVTNENSSANYEYNVWAHEKKCSMYDVNLISVRDSADHLSEIWYQIGQLTSTVYIVNKKKSVLPEGG